MFNLEPRIITVFGLAGAILTWMLIWTIVILMRYAMYNAVDNCDGLDKDTLAVFKKFKRVWGSLFWPGHGLIFLARLCIMVWGGWKPTNNFTQPQGVLEAPQGTLFRDVETVQQKKENLRKEGTQLQTAGLEELDAWRQDFFNKRKQQENKNEDKNDN